MLPEQYGCVCFDDPKEHASGYAASSAWDYPRRIRDTGQLSSDTVWLTNLDFNLSYESGFNAHARFRRSDYLRRDYRHIGDGMGLNEAAIESGAPLALSYLQRISRAPVRALDAGGLEIARAHLAAQLFARTARLSERLFDVTHLPNYRYSLAFRDLLMGPDPEVPEWVGQIIEEATVRKVWCERSAREGMGQIVWFRLPATALAQRLLVMPMLSGRWQRIKRPSDADVQRLCESGQGFLARVVVEHTGAQFNRLLNFGSGATSRQWVTSVDLIYLRALCEVSVREVVVAERSDLATQMMQSRELLAYLDQPLSLSVSAQLMAENLWAGLASRQVTPINNRLACNSAAPFIFAGDRIECMDRALRLLDAGADVVNYGFGSVAVRLSAPVDPRQVIALAQLSETLPPAIGADFEESIKAFGTDSPLAIQQAMHLAGALEELLALDERALGALERKLEAISAPKDGAQEEGV